MMTTADTIIAAEHHPASVEIAATARRNRLSPIRVVTTELWPDMLFSLLSIFDEIFDIIIDDPYLAL